MKRIFSARQLFNVSALWSWKHWFCFETGNDFCNCFCWRTACTITPQYYDYFAHERTVRKATTYFAELIFPTLPTLLTLLFRNATPSEQTDLHISSTCTISTLRPHTSLHAPLILLESKNSSLYLPSDPSRRELLVSLGPHHLTPFKPASPHVRAPDPGNAPSPQASCSEQLAVSTCEERLGKKVSLHSDSSPGPPSRPTTASEAGIG